MSFNTLREGDRGDAVTLWQHILNRDTTLTVPLVAEDGVFGPKTTLRTKNWQAKRKLVADGIVGSVTWSRAADELGGTLPGLPVGAPVGKAVPAFVGARFVDSYPFSLAGTASQAQALRRAEVDGLAGYLGVITRARVEAVIAAGLGFFGVTLANRLDGTQAVAQARTLGLPPETSLALDIEGKAIFDQGGALFAPVKRWREIVQAANYKTLLYAGSPQPLTSTELEQAGFDGYWNALSRESDRFGQLAEPARGWCAWQMIPQLTWKDTGVFVDVNIVGQDFRGVQPLTWAMAG